MHQTPAPFFSVIIPTYNRAGLIGATIHSLLQQTFTDFEIIVVDDGSTDNTAEAIAQLNEPRIKYFKKENGGVSSARNYGIDKSVGTYLNFFDSDDLAYPNHLQEAKSFIDTHPEAKIILFDFEWGDLARKNVQEVLMRYEDPNAAILSLNYPSTNCVFLHRSVFEQLRFNESLTIAEDWDFWLKNSVRHTFHLGRVKTSYFVDHSQRSVRQFDLDKLLKQKDLLLSSLRADSSFYKAHRSKLSKIDAHMLSYIAIHGAIEGRKKPIAGLFFRSLWLDPKSVFNKRTLAIVKHLLFTW